MQETTSVELQFSLTTGEEWIQSSPEPVSQWKPVLFVVECYNGTMTAAMKHAGVHVKVSNHFGAQELLYN